MNKPTSSKIRVPTVDELDDSPSTSTLSTSKFTKFRQNVEADASTADKGDSTESKKPKMDQCTRSREEEAGTRTEIGSTGANRSGGAAVVVSPRQKGNPLLRFVRNVPYEFGQISADYILGASCCALFLSLKFHKLHSDYVHERMKDVGHSFALQILLVQVDTPEPDQSLRELNTICFTAGWTLVLTWSPEEAAEYVEAFKIYENKPPDFLMGKQETDPRSRLVDLLTSIKSITRTDAENLIAAFGSLKNMVEASEEQLALCPGLGLKKAKRLYAAFGATWRADADMENEIIALSTDDDDNAETNAAVIEKGNNSDDLFEDNE